ncbi:cobalamin-5'-phosphate synthase [Paracoccus halophilus]|uniref:Adenosylcobinamide-GDP ribazoletransferase n=1 Tax=Paracoccus halophilus TaxID=376733 RepID=A0A1I0T3B2_9RHOB|nr:adenosylcobinamide-GDP ribazoletransferase [Paracoccus halophilus]SFA46249.1 cobalamin-5'-phosphate synthase [Paracoccus halophilus]
MARAVLELATAFVWLTRFPLAGLVSRELPPLARTGWAFPLVGLAVGLMAALVLALAAWLGLPAPVAALLAVAAMVLATGGLHEDGLADLADAGGGADRDRRLAIMRDSRIGSYGVLALILVTGLRIAAIAALFAAAPMLAIAALPGIAAASRAGMVAGLGLMPPARPDGLGRLAGRSPPGQIAMAILLAGLALLAPALATDRPALAAAAAAVAIGLAQLWLAHRAMRRLGGQTGDVLGAMQQAGEAAGLVALTLFV